MGNSDRADETRQRTGGTVRSGQTETKHTPKPEQVKRPKTIMNQMYDNRVAATVIGLCLSLVVLQFRGGEEVKITETLNESYDYVVVGSGPGGSVMAVRLTEMADVSVLVLEAGTHYEEDPDAHTPALWPNMLHGNFDWEYYTEPQSHSSLGLNDRRQYWPRGKVLGGTSVTNLLQYNRGSRFDYDKWAELGCTGWSYKDVLPFFKKSEDMLAPELTSSEFHGKGGPLAVCDGRVSDMFEKYLEAGKELGYDIVDYNGWDHEGFSPYQLNVRNGVRSSASKEFLRRASGRPNLHIAINSFVTKVKIENKKATGVYVIRHGRKVFIRANKEVILAGGVINSPQLLMLSGVGPRDHLEKLGVPVIADLPVGDNLQDHMRLQLFTRINESLSITPVMKQSWLTKLQYRLFGTGILSRTIAEVTSFWYLDEQNRGKTYTDVQMNFFSSFLHGNVVNFNDTLFKKTFQSGPSTHGFTTAMIMNHMKSKGTLRLRSTDPYDYPIMSPNLLSNETDVSDFLKAIRLWQKLINTKTMRSIGASTDALKEVAVCQEFEFDSDEYWKCHTRHLAITSYHPCCTCKMGSAKDPTTVVDPRLRVKGIKGLRVVDGSVFPQEPTGNTNAPTFMVAEKGASLVIEDMKKQ